MPNQAGRRIRHCMGGDDTNPTQMQQCKQVDRLSNLMETAHADDEMPMGPPLEQKAGLQVQMLPCYGCCHAGAAADLPAEVAGKRLPSWLRPEHVLEENWRRTRLARSAYHTRARSWPTASWQLFRSKTCSCRSFLQQAQIHNRRDQNWLLLRHQSH
jgi:hypothetical protein